MKKSIVYTLLFVSILQSCGTSSNVTSNFSIQKRKYTKGWNVKDLFQKNQLSNKSETTSTELASSTENKSIVNTNVTSNEEENELFSEPNKQTISETSIVESKTSGNDDILSEETSTRSNTILVKSDEFAITSDENPKDNETVSPELIKFNNYHKIMLVLLIFSPATLFISLFPLYVLLILQRFKFAHKVPLEERDEKYYRKKIFAGTFFILGTILLTIAIIMTVAVLIFLA